MSLLQASSPPSSFPLRYLTSLSSLLRAHHQLLTSCVCVSMLPASPSSLTQKVLLNLLLSLIYTPYTTVVSTCLTWWCSSSTVFPSSRPWLIICLSSILPCLMLIPPLCATSHCILLHTGIYRLMGRGIPLDYKQHVVNPSDFYLDCKVMWVIVILRKYLRIELCIVW